MADVYAKINVLNPSPSNIGTVVNVQEMNSGDNQDPNFTWVDVQNIKCNDGTAVGVSCTYDGAIFYPAPLPSQRPLNQQFAPTDYGQFLIDQLSAQNVANGLTPSQVLIMETEFAAIRDCLQDGALETALTALQNVTPDGVIVTQTMLTQFEGAIQAYLAGD
jgi:hypothetical protein